MNWKFWKKNTTAKPKKKKSATREWIDAIIFAVIAATIIRTFFIEAYTIPTSSMEKSLLIGDFLFVSKVSYGPRIPNTPLAFPFAHHTLPLTKSAKSYVEWIKIPYYRLWGFSDIKNDDVVVFNYPMEDFRPVDKRENYIKRCVGIPGDSLQVKDRILFVNGKQAAMPEKMQHKYQVITDGSAFNPKTLSKLDITEGGKLSEGNFQLTLTEENSQHVSKFSNVKKVLPIIERKGRYEGYTFPSDSSFPWNIDNYGPIYIPKKGVTVDLTLKNLPMYERLITIYEGNELKKDNGKIYINGAEVSSYTFKMDYYFMMGDNRQNSEDSRFWGFVPEDHIVGKAVFIWFSWDSNASGLFDKIRWSRLFSLIH
jgi:signal peptidase I